MSETGLDRTLRAALMGVISDEGVRIAVFDREWVLTVAAIVGGAGRGAYWE